jgi:hypothetical protein
MTRISTLAGRASLQVRRPPLRRRPSPTTEDSESLPPESVAARRRRRAPGRKTGSLPVSRAPADLAYGRWARARAVAAAAKPQRPGRADLDHCDCLLSLLKLLRKVTVTVKVCQWTRDTPMV